MKAFKEFDIDERDIYIDKQSGRINNICINKLDRLTRSVKDLEEILVLLEECNCGLMSVTEEINTKG